MRKQIAIIAVLLLVCLAGCSSTPKFPIDRYSWEMTTVQSGEKGSVIACSAELADRNEGAEVIALTCKAEDGYISVADLTDSETYTGEYRVTETSSKATIYEIKIGDTTGHAVTSMTTYRDESESPTLIISIGDYALNFQAISETTGE